MSSQKLCVSQIVSQLFPFSEKTALVNALKSSKKYGSVYYGMVKRDILDSWRAARTEGNSIHNDIEHRIKHSSRSESIAAKIYENFLTENSLVPLNYFCEFTLIDEEYNLGGKIDAVFITKTGEVCIVDWKRCKKLFKESKECAQYPMNDYPNTNFWKYSLQLNFYRYLYEKKFNVSVPRCYIVIINIKKVSYEIYEVPNLQTKVKEIISILGRKQ